VGTLPGGSKTTSAEDALSRLKEVEAELHRMTKVFMDGADPIVIRDLDGNVLDINLETERIFGWRREEVLGKRAKLQLAPEYRELADEILTRVQHGDTVRNLEVVIRSKTGEMIPVLASVFPLTDESGQLLGYAEIAKDITQLKRANSRLERKNRELKQFANVLGHDLRAPLHTIRGFADLVQSECHEERGKQCQAHLREIMEGADRMERLIGDVLAYTQVENQAISLELVNCQDVFQEALSNLQAVIIENGAEITSETLPTVQSNRTQMMQLFQNLLDNAMKYRGVSPPRIHVSCEQGEGQWTFSIRDNGIGMDAEHLHRVFDAFHRLHADGVFPGTGIGLSICRGIVERHGGRIWVESEKGRGSVFKFAIPKQPSEQSAGASTSARTMEFSGD
jgi:PAS domain S-box-containing protein